MSALQQEAALLETYEAASVAAMGALERAYDVSGERFALQGSERSQDLSTRVSGFYTLILI